ncbi:MAG: lysophospholipid acyltransferase family protein [Rikenellaceae bacterium]
MKQKIGYILLKGACVLVGFMPLWLAYNTLSPLLFFVLYHVVGYRRKVVVTNLKNSFPEKSDKEIKDIERKFYHNLADVFVDTIRMASLSKKEVQRRLVFDNLEVMPNKDTICAMAHYGSWELSVSYGLIPDQHTIGIYRPLHSKVFDKFYIFMRRRFGSDVAPMNYILKDIINKRRDPNALPLTIAMIADQTPGRKEQRHWHNFLNQETSFFGGIEKISTKFEMPIYFANMTMPKRGYYVCHFELIYDGVEKVEQAEITRRYAEKLEKMIRQRPELWLWSHRRWKHKRPQE